MDLVKKTAIIGGAVVGGIVGGTLSILGHITKIKVLDELGDSIVDSTILTGGIAGDAISGVVDVVSGGVSRKPNIVRKGEADLLGAGKRVVGNYVNNAKLLIENSGDIVQGVKRRDGKQILNGAKTMGKIVAVGFITVGAIKVKSTKYEIPEDAKDTETETPDKPL